MHANNDPFKELISEDDVQKICSKEEAAIELEGRCIRLIHEFLLSYELEATLDVFIKECLQQGFTTPEPPVERKERINRTNVHKILEYFTQNDFLNFFNAWESLVPQAIQKRLEYKKLTFYLHIHFAVLPLRLVELHANESIQNTSNSVDVVVWNDDKPAGNGLQDVNSSKNESSCDKTENLLSTKEEKRKKVQTFNSMEMLRQFLETKGTEFSAEPEFLPYYALPFVNDPTTHPSFKELFMDQWVTHLTSSLQHFVEEHSWGATVAPKLMQMCEVQQQQSNSRSQTVQGNYKQLRRRYHKLHKDHHNLLSVATELTGALENSFKGHAVDLETTLHNCSKIFPELFTYTEFAETVPESQEDPLSLSGSLELDFKKIKHHLATGSVKTKLLLLQALRWRITRSGLDERDTIVNAFLRHDVLSLSRGLGSGSLASHFSPLQATTPHPLQQAAARLVNTLASLRTGRDYLCSADCGLLNILIPCIKGEHGVHIDAITSDMILATLQKLSLRHNQRVWMLEAGLVEWLVRRLSEEGAVMKAYALEYSTALLMNLCLHRRAKERCVPLAKTVLKMLTDLLGTELTQAVPYVNGTLYSLLANSQINHEAKRMGLASILEYYLKHSNGEMHKQLEYILKLHRGDCQPDHSATSEEENADDDTEEVDLLEDELDADDPVRTLPGELSGEDLLYQQYRLLFPYHGVVHPSSSGHGADLLVRPTTPRLHSPHSPHPTTSGSTVSLSTPATNSENSKASFLSLSNTLEQVQEVAEIDDHAEILAEIVNHDDSIILENLESELEKDEDDIVSHCHRGSAAGQSNTERTGDMLTSEVESQAGTGEGGHGNSVTQTSRPTSAMEDGCQKK